MGSEWIEQPLGDFIELKRGYDLPKRLRVPGTVPLISSSGESDKHSVAKVSGPGVVTGRYGTIGEVFYTQSDFWPLNTTLYVKDFKGNHPKFTYYFLQTLDFNQFSDKAAVPGVNRNHLHMALVKTPRRTEQQKAIAHILGSLDDKIELNRKINQTLESMAQALFKSWFVDFDPVIDNALAAGNSIPEALQARAATRQAAAAASNGDTATVTQLPAELRQQFPSEFEFTDEMGWVPKGWEQATLGEISEILNGFAFKSGDYVPAGNFVLRTKNFGGDGGAQRLDDDVYLPDSFMTTHQKYLCEEFDPFVVMVGASIGKVAIIFEDCLPALRNQNMWCFRAKPNCTSQFFVTFSMKAIVKGNAQSATGSARDFFRKDFFRERRLVLPPPPLLSEFDSHALPMFRRISTIRLELQSLTNLRDTLLPKLISGELRIPDAEKLVAEAEG